MNQTESQYRLLQTELHFLNYTNCIFFFLLLMHWTFTPYRVCIATFFKLLTWGHLFWVVNGLVLLNHFFTLPENLKCFIQHAPLPHPHTHYTPVDATKSNLEFESSPGIFVMQTRDAGDKSTNFAINRWPALPSALWPALYIVGSTQLFPFQLHILLKLFYLSMSTDTFLKSSIDCKRTSDIFKILDTIVISCCKRCQFWEKEIIDKLFLSNR